MEAAKGHLGRGCVGEELMAGEAMLLLHGAAENLLHAARYHRQPCHYQPQHVVLHLQVCHRPAACQAQDNLILIAQPQGWT